MLKLLTTGHIVNDIYPVRQDVIHEGREVGFETGSIDGYNTWGRDNADVFYREEVTLVNGFVEFTPLDQRYRVSVYGRNLTDETIKSGTVAVLFPLTYYQPPREFGVEAQWNF